MTRFGLVAGLLIVLLSSCNQSANRVSTLWTNVPEVASAVEKFNASQRDWQLLVEYREDPAALLTAAGTKPDLVVARGLASAAVKDTMAPLDFLFDGGNLARAAFFRRSLEPGQQGDRLKLLPVSFDLPIFVFSRAGEPELPGFSLSVTALRDLNAAFNAVPVGKGPSRLAFSPRWDGFGPTFLQWTGSSFREGFQGTLTWSGSGLASSLEQFRAWPSPGWDRVTAFQSKYLQSDPAPSLLAGRIQFYPSTLATFLDRPWKERRGLDFRFLDQGGRVLAAETTVWAGIPSSSLTRGAGERFLAWLFRAETQKSLIEGARNEDDRNFGLAQGLSSLVESNAGALVEALPELEGRLPGADQVAFWPELPAEWTVLRANVVRPWVEAPATTEAQLKTSLEKQRSQAVRR